MDNPVIATPLNGAGFEIDGLSVVEQGVTCKINLRGDFESPSVISALTELTGLQQDSATNTWTGNGAGTLFWLGPDERLLYTDGNPQGIIERWCESAGTSAVDVSDYSTVLRLSGAKVRDVIASGTPFDVHADNFAPGQCAQTRFGNATILLSNHGETPVPEFQLQVRWSFAEYVFNYIKRVSSYV